MDRTHKNKKPSRIQKRGHNSIKQYRSEWN